MNHDPDIGPALNPDPDPILDSDFVLDLDPGSAFDSNSKNYPRKINPYMGVPQYLPKNVSLVSEHNSITILRQRLSSGCHGRPEVALGYTHYRYPERTYDSQK
ncbi:hypothetical protein EVAR_101669_1 [Eumeta japonica]|uniref:Uncharacterized protein n=1 Tax=Eumeta variegata TaxID=151549 RepID=A0A4C2A8M7_EUMVA|nr:hypothetical protein EVAR_101669_1 [Eumeta japonica]